MIYILKTETNHTTVDCSTEAGKTFLNSDHAHFNRRRKLWIIEPDHVASLTTWLRANGHTVINDNDDRAAPQPPLWQHDDVDWDQQAAINAAGIAATRAALRAEQP
jgi:hypothetical protein